MSGLRCTEEFRRDAVAQVTEQAIQSLKFPGDWGSLYDWKKQYHKPEPERAKEAVQASEVRHLKAELARVTEERDILKKVPPNYLARTSQGMSSEVRLHQSASSFFSGSAYVPYP